MSSSRSTGRTRVRKARSSLSVTTPANTPASKPRSGQVLLADTNVQIMPGRPIPDVWNSLVRGYESRVYGAVVMHLLWDDKYAKAIRQISPKRADNRKNGYLDSKEMERALAKLESKRECSIRFGAEKLGHGYSGERGDFCLVGGVVRGSNLSLFYRSLELIGGFAYDLTLINEVETWFAQTVRFQTLTIYTTKAFVFALKGNSNEKLYPKLQEIFRS